MNNIQRLGNTLSGRMVKTARDMVPMTIELGMIVEGKKLKVDSLPAALYPFEYMVDIRLTHETYFTYNELNSSASAPHHHEGGEHVQFQGTGHHTHDDGLHDHRLPACFRGLEVGDRVLVAWVGHEPIVMAVVVSGDSISTNTAG